MASVEMDPSAVATLRLRAAARHAVDEDGCLPTAYHEFIAGRLSHDRLTSHPTFAAHWTHAEDEVHQHVLSEQSRATSDEFIGRALHTTVRRDDPWVLVGGPPCQAYSMVGRSRRRHDASFKDDHKHTLYREYLHLIATFRPHVFVMENVKGMLSSQHGGGPIFQAIAADLEHPAPDLKYTIRSCVVAGEAGGLDPSDFVIRAERYGVPQARHRVILLGVRSDVGVPSMLPLTVRRPVSVGDVLDDLPSIRSGVSRGENSEERWLAALMEGAKEAGVRLPKGIRPPAYSRGYVHDYQPRLSGELGEWIRGHAAEGVAQHESRNHMPQDLARYAYLAFKGKQGERPKVTELPSALRPLHSNLTQDSVPFTDRFRVQLQKSPSSTVTSHISKDGHYFIHHDPLQMRSLSVREAARLQTFPDDYFFMGGRTQQYHQVGNAVPPFLAKQIGEIVAGLLGRGPVAP
ncbi:DNA cytosine methyltransferase [Phycicoccus sp. Soil748]|uniref:DNA cytosine methyltransferase n=1 Tax=Phycicoccus sp. Soil748 TaxID=1736397 RepID=UPI001F2610B1|nr:DNA cytosine methyltransferase [Phycicoccus sp. Soil748]